MSNNVTPIKITTPTVSSTTSPILPNISNNSNNNNNNNNKTPTKTLRFEVELNKLKKKEVDYKSLVQKYIAEQNKDNINSSFYEKNGSSIDKDNDILNLDLPTLTTPKNRLTDLINKIEKIHANGPVFHDDGEVDSEDDDDDSFIDDTEVMDFDETLETELGGFFVNIGSIKYKDRGYDDEMNVDDDEYEQPPSRSRRNHHHHHYQSEEDGDDENEQQEGEEEVEGGKEGEEEDQSQETSTVPAVKKQSPPKKKTTSSGNKPAKIINIESPEIEQMLKELEREVTNWKDDMKLLPKSIAPLLAKLYTTLKSTNSQGNLPTSAIQRISTFWKFKEKTIKSHLKKAYLDIGQMSQDILTSKIDKLNEYIKDIKKTINSDMEEQLKYAKPVPPPPSKDDLEKKEGDTPQKEEPKYIFTKVAREIIFQTVKLNKEIVDIKNRNSNENIIEKTSRATLYKKIINCFPLGWITPKSLANAYSYIRNNERKLEKKQELQLQIEKEKEKQREKEKQEKEEKEKEKEKKDLTISNTTTTTTTTSNDKHHHDIEKKHHISSSSSTSSKPRDKERSKDKDRHKSPSSSSSSKDKDRHRSSSSSSSSSTSKDKDKHRDRKDRKRLLNDVDLMEDMTNYKKHKSSSHNSSSSKPPIPNTVPIFTEISSSNNI